jgi:DNA-binding transcriptional regulator YhcF (GntR family)
MLWDSKVEWEPSQNARRALAYARDEAIQLQHEYVGTEHILLGVLRTQDPLIEAVMEALEVTPTQIRDRLEESLRRGKGLPLTGELPYTSRGKKTLEFAMSEARADEAQAAEGRKAGRTLDVDHLLVGLMREEKGIAAVVLRSFGVTLPRLRSELRAAAARLSSEPAFRITIDDASDRSIYEQIVRRVQEAAATGELQPGERLPTVRQLADELDVAPGTVARAYTELEQLGVVVTEGARGTRVAGRRSKPGRQGADVASLAGLLRPVAVAAYHLGADAAALRAALEIAMRDIFAEGPAIP